MNKSSRAIVLALLVLTPASGCFGGGDDGTTTSPTPTDDGNMTMPVMLTLTLGNVTAMATHKTPIYVEWSVASDANDSIPLDLVEVAYGNVSVGSDNLTNDTAYANRAGNETAPTAPGSYNMTFTVTTPGTVYLRAHAIHQGTHFWSDEAMVTVEIGKGATTTITYPAGAVTGAVDATPANPTLKLGAGIKLTNSDQVAHNLVCTSTAPQPCSIGSTPASGSSAAVYLTKAGTYSFGCTLHASTMASMGTFTVSNELN